MEYLRRANEKENRFDLIILDPPSFARFDGKTFRVQKDLEPLMAMAVKALNPGGFLFVATNFNGLSHQQLENGVRKASAGREIAEIQRLEQDEDFVGSGWSPESYLAALLVKLE